MLCRQSGEHKNGVRPIHFGNKALRRRQVGGRENSCGATTLEMGRGKGEGCAKNVVENLQRKGRRAWVLKKDAWHGMCGETGCAKGGAQSQGNNWRG